MLGRVGKVGRLGSIGGLEGIPAPDLQLNFDQASIGANAAPDDAIDFSRASQATFTDSDGLVKYAPHNLLPYSEQVDDAKSYIADATISNNATTAPNGTTTADKLVNNTDNDEHYVRFAITALANTSYNVSVYLKAGEITQANILFAQSLNWSSNHTIRVNLSTGAVSTISGSGVSNFTSENVGNGWYRISLNHTVSGSAGTTSFDIRQAVDGSPNDGTTFAGNGSDGLFIWGLQISQHKFVPVGNPYIKTTSAAVYGARLDHEAGYFLSANQAQNLVEYSEQLDNSYWTIVSGVSVSANQGTSPDGTTTADKFIAANTSRSFQALSVNISVPDGSSNVFSIYAKADERDKFALREGSLTGVFASFDLTNGTVITDSSATASIEDDGNGWFRCSIQAAVNDTFGVRIIPLPDSYTGGSVTGAFSDDGTSGVLIWGAQLEVASSVGTYVKTEGLPYYGGGATQNGLLIEEQRVNSVTHSEELDNAAWTKSNSTVTANDTTAPDGTTTADKLVENSSTTQHVVYASPTITANSTNTFSVYIKADERDSVWVQLANSGFSSGFRITVADISTTPVLATATFGTGSIDDFGYENVGNGWFRFHITGVVDSSSTTARAGVYLRNASDQDSYTGDGSSGLHLWGAQVEEGAFPTSYIPTSGSTVTRSADLATMGPVTGTNLALQSEDLSSVSWSKTRSSISANAIASPDGLTTADTLVEDTTASSNHFANQQFTFVADKIYVYSLYAKAISGATNRNIAVQVQAKDNSFPGVIIDPADGTASAPYGGAISAGIQDVGNDWYRGHVVFDSQSGAVNGQLYAVLRDASNNPNYTGDGSSGMHVWGAQLEQAPTLITDAEDFTTGLTVTGVTVTANQIAAPNGTTTADLIKEDSSNGAHRLIKAVSVEGNQPYTFSVFAKAATFSGNRRLSLIHAGAGIYPFTQTDYDLVNGTVSFSSHESANINDVGNGWFRLTVTETSIGPGSAQFRILFNLIGNSYQGDNTSGVYLWGLQAEKGASATPYPPEPTKYLPTYASTNLPFVGYNQNQGTINSEFTALGSGAFLRIYDLVDNTDALNEKMALSNRSASDPDEGTESIVTGGTNQIFNAFDLTPNVLIKYSRAYKTNDSAAEIRDGTGGVDSHSDTSVTLPTTINELGIGVKPDNNTAVGNLIMKRFHYYASRLKNDFLKRLR